MPSTEQTTSKQEDAVRRFVLDAIEDGTISAGERLPTERVLAERFGLPRSAVRKALAPLELEGLIKRSVGRGTFVSKCDADLTSPADSSPLELLEAAMGCYPYMCELAVARATQSDLRAIADCIRPLKDAATIEEYEAEEAALHQAIADATHNALLIEMARAIGRARERIHWGALKHLHEGAPEDHQAILDALVNRDAKLAHERMRAHLNYARRCVLGTSN